MYDYVYCTSPQTFVLYKIIEYDKVTNAVIL